MVNPTHKGKRGEVEFCKWLKKHFGIDTERNYNQAGGGADITTEHFLFEVKRREQLNLDDWWHQVVIAKKQKHPNDYIVPVVCFRQNRKKWEFLIPADFIGCSKGYVRLSEKVFIEFAKAFIEGRPMPGLLLD